MYSDKQKTAIENDIEHEKVQYLEHDNSSDMLKIMGLLQNPPNIESNTILTNEQVNGLSLMNMYGQIYDIQFFKQYVSLFPRYRISGDDGRGRKELIKIAEAIQKEKMETQERMLEFLGKR